MRRSARAFGPPAGLALLLSSGCPGAERGAEPQQSPAPAGATDEPEPADEGPWLYLPTLRKYVPEGVTARPFLEASGGRTGELWILTVSHGGEGGPRIERWDFHTPQGEQVVQLRAGPTPFLRLDADDDADPAVSALRRALASPGVKRSRRAGLPAAGDSPKVAVEQVVGQLHRHALTFRDANASERDRADALLELVTGLDDAIVLERDELGLAIDRLMLAGAAQQVDASARIGTAEVVAGDELLELELLAKGEGWVISAMRPVTGDPDQPAPDP